MDKAEESKKNACEKMKNSNSIGMAGGGYGLAFFGAAVYFVQHSDGFWAGVLGILKAMVWPAFLIHKIFTLLGM